GVLEFAEPRCWCPRALEGGWTGRAKACAKRLALVSETGEGLKLLHALAKGSVKKWLTPSPVIDAHGQTGMGCNSFASLHPTTAALVSKGPRAANLLMVASPTL